jgi:hypothetical protein
MNATASFKLTQLREFYAALGALKEQEQTALAELHAEDPARLLRRFELSVATVAEYAPITHIGDPLTPEAFHDGKRKALADPPVPVDEIRRTEHFASQLVNRGGAQCVEGAPELAFRYVDREIFALRSTAADQRAETRWLDLLLASADGLPIVAELKIDTDKPAYFALIQALMYAAELSSPSQRARLAAIYPEVQFTMPADGPFLDVYLIAFKPPSTGVFRQRSFEATEQLSSKLVEDPRATSVIRRIAYIEAVPGDEGLFFVKRFLFAATA